jgi:sugar-specific transcriptional regulator TrmB
LIGDAGTEGESKAMADIESATENLRLLGLQEYHAKALACLMMLGRSKAPEVSRESKIPKARIYGVLEDLVDMGYVELFSGRPMEYASKSPEDILRVKLDNERSEYEATQKNIDGMRGDFTSSLGPVYEEGLSDKSRTMLLRIVRVGDASERETRLLYDEAEREIGIISKVLEYLPKLEDDLCRAAGRGVKVRVLLLGDEQLSGPSRDVRESVTARLRERVPGVEIRLSRNSQPLRGSIIDPSMDYEGGKALILVEERGTPLYLRDAAVTENPSLVAGLSKYFDAAWEHEADPI